MVQCQLRKPVESGFAERIAFIPDKFAIVGNWLRIRVRGAWLPGEYKVAAVFGRKSDEAVNSLHASHRAFTYYEAKNRKR